MKEIQERLVKLGVDVILMTKSVDFREIPDHIVNQIGRSSTSPGANYHEAQAASSRRDFHHKCKIALKELHETHYWFEIIEQIIENKAKVSQLKSETNELVRIFVTICRKTDPRFERKK